MMVARPTVQEMIKAAMSGVVGRREIENEAARQAGTLEEKTASDASETAASYEEIMKLAEAVEFLAEEFAKEAEPGKGPNALHVTESPGGSSLPDHKGQAKHVVPFGSKLQNVGRSSATTQMSNDIDHRPGGNQTQQNAMVGAGGKHKRASAIREAVAKLASEKELEEKETEGLNQAEAGIDKAEKAHKQEKSASLADRLRAAQTKVAEDAINPARISAGKTVPPDTRESGQPGGPTVPDMSKIDTNEKVINLTRREAKAVSKSDMKAYVTEPALSKRHDNVLDVAFKHTNQAGAKIASDMAGAVKTAAAKSLLNRISQAQRA